MKHNEFLLPRPVGRPARFGYLAASRNTTFRPQHGSAWPWQYRWCS